MTRPSKQIRMNTKWRRQVARLLASIEIYGDARVPLRENSRSTGRMLDTGGTDWERWDSLAVRIEVGADGFDVAKARAYAKRLVAMADEHQVFVDWTRAQGKAPDNREPGAFGVLHDGFIATATHCAPGLHRFGVGGLEISINVQAADSAADVAEQLAAAARAQLPGWSVEADGDEVRFRQLAVGGWPGKLAREYGWRRCDACDGRGRQAVPADEARMGPALRRGRLTFVGGTDGGAKLLVRCDACNGRGRQRRPGRPPGIAVGRSLARVGQRLLDMLDGRCPWAPSAAAQPSDCQFCSSPLHGKDAVVSLADGGKATPRKGQHVALLAVESMVVGGDGQPRLAQQGEFVVVDCTSCRGTGNNLAGVLPAPDIDTRLAAYIRRQRRERGLLNDEEIARRFSINPQWRYFTEEFLHDVAGRGVLEDFNRLLQDISAATSDNGRALDQFAQAVLETSAGEARRLQQARATRLRLAGRGK